MLSAEEKPPFVNLTCKYPVGSVTVYLGLGDAYKQDDELETVVRVERLIMPESDWRAEDIRPNPAQRELAKLMINSLWGKCAERMNFVEKKICHSFEDVRAVLNRHRDGFKGVEHWTELPNVCVLTYQQDRDTVQQPKAYQHPHLACFTTSMARVHLYRTSLGYLHPSQLLYADTDSVVFVYDRQNPYHKKMDCSKGYLLGEYKDELGAGERMKRFYALAPKTYAYEHTISEAKRAEIECEPDALRRQLNMQNATECVKMKGFSLSTEMALQCNVDGFKKMVMGEQECFVVQDHWSIRADECAAGAAREKSITKSSLCQETYSTDGRVGYVYPDTL
eukprot:CFRG4090T1